jgi:hypothetical protein
VLEFTLSFGSQNPFAAVPELSFVVVLFIFAEISDQTIVQSVTKFLKLIDPF